MIVEPLPNLTRPVRQLWESIRAKICQLLLANVWRGPCCHEVTITNFSGTITGGEPLLT